MKYTNSLKATKALSGKNRLSSYLLKKIKFMTIFHKVYATTSWLYYTFNKLYLFYISFSKASVHIIL